MRISVRIEHSTDDVDRRGWSGKVPDTSEDLCKEKGITRRRDKVGDKIFDEEMSFAKRPFCVRLCV